jgi:hypothetical protein
LILLKKNYGISKRATGHLSREVAGRLAGEKNGYGVKTGKVLVKTKPFMLQGLMQSTTSIAGEYPYKYGKFRWAIKKR